MCDRIFNKNDRLEINTNTAQNVFTIIGSRILSQIKWASLYVWLLFFLFSKILTRFWRCNFYCFFFLEYAKNRMMLIYKLYIYPRYEEQQKKAHRNDFELFALSFDMRFLAVVQFMCIGIIYRKNDSRVIFYSRWADYFWQQNHTVYIIYIIVVACLCLK